jgi:arginine/lysine/histidine transporter system substrate-binding protein
MKNLKKVAAICLAAAMLVPFAACSKKSDKIVMSTEATVPPFEYYSGKEIVGIDVEIAKKIAAKAGKELEIRNVAFDSLSNELSSGKCDFVAAGMTVTEDRKKNMDFSDTYFDATQSIIVLKNSSIKSRTDLNGKTVGVQQGTTGDTYCTDEEKTSDIHVKTVKRYNKGSDAISDLIAGRLDAVVIDDFPAQKFVENNSDKIIKLDDALTVEHYAIAVKKGNTDLLNTINSVLAEMKSSGELDKLIEENKAALEKAKETFRAAHR